MIDTIDVCIRKDPDRPFMDLLNLYIDSINTLNFKINEIIYRLNEMEATKANTDRVDALTFEVRNIQHIMSNR